MHIQETRHAKHKTRLDKTPRRGMRRHTNIRQTHSKTSTTRQAQQDTHNKTQARMGYTGGHGVCPPGVSTHGISPKNGFPPSHGAGSGRLQGGGGGGRGRGGGGGDTPAPSQLESQWESQELPNQLQDPLLRASHGANTGSVDVTQGQWTGQARGGETDQLLSHPPRLTHPGYDPPTCSGYPALVHGGVDTPAAGTRGGRGGRTMVHRVH